MMASNSTTTVDNMDTKDYHKVIKIGEGWNSNITIKIKNGKDLIMYSYLQRNIKEISYTFDPRISLCKLRISFGKNENDMELSRGYKDQENNPIKAIYDEVMRHYNEWCVKNDSFGYDKYQIPEELIVQLMQPALKLTQKNAETAMTLEKQLGDVVGVLKRINNLMTPIDK